MLCGYVFCKGMDLTIRFDYLVDLSRGDLEPVRSQLWMSSSIPKQNIAGVYVRTMILSTVLILDDVLPCQMAWYLQIIVLFHLGKVQKLMNKNTIMSHNLVLVDRGKYR